MDALKVCRSSSGGVDMTDTFATGRGTINNFTLVLDFYLGYYNSRNNFLDPRVYKFVILFAESSSNGDRGCAVILKINSDNTLEKIPFAGNGAGTSEMLDFGYETGDYVFAQGYERQWGIRLANEHCSATGRQTVSAILIK